MRFIPGLVLALWLVVNLLIPLDKEQLPAFQLALAAMVLLGVVGEGLALDRAARRKWGGSLAILLGVSLLSLLNILRKDGLDLPYSGIVGSCVEAGLCLLLHQRLMAWATQSIGPENKVHGALRWAIRLLSALFFWGYGSCFFGRHPSRAFRYFVEEMGLFIPAAQLLLLHALRRGSIRPYVLASVICGLLYTAGTAVVFGVALEGGSERRMWLDREMGWIRDWNDDNPPPLRRWRVQFPFQHHNRMASYAMMILFLSLAEFVGRSGKRRTAGMLAVLPLLAVFASQTRGAYLSVLGGLIVAMLAGNRSWRRAGAVLLLSGAAMALAFPGPRRSALSIVRPETYTSPASSAAARFRAWRAGAAMAMERPYFGVGFGSKNFEYEYQRDFMDPRDLPDGQPHAHNTFIEIAAEMGFPALALYASFLSLIGIGLWRARGDGRPMPAPILLGLWAATIAYSIANHNLRLGIGCLMWVTLALMAARALAPAPHPGADADAD